MDDNTIKVLFSSKDQSHATPQDFFDKVDKEFNFDLDVCATSQSAKCSEFFTKENDAFKQDWIGNCWMNPPYGRESIH
jgi:phage N-6-adenine-methyltransferase